MQFLYFMTFTSLSLLVVSFSYTYYETFGDHRDTCRCVCVDSSQSAAKLSSKSKVVYHGLRTGKSCSCEDFLVPWTGEQLLAPSGGNSTCKLCDCGYAAVDYCDDSGRVTFSRDFQLIAALFSFITSLMWLLDRLEGLKKACSERKASDK